MDFFKQYIKLISYALMGLVFMFASFYLFANCYHYLELRKDYVVNFNEQTQVINMDDTLRKVSQNISSFNANSYNGNMAVNDMQIKKQQLEQCVQLFNNDTVQEMRTKDRITIVDVYNLRESYEDIVLNKCIVGNLFWTTNVDENSKSTYLKNNKALSKLYVDELISDTSYLKKDLINNSSYFYNTSVASNSVKDNTRDGFWEVMDAYNKAANYVLYVSEWFRMEVGG